MVKDRLVLLREAVYALEEQAGRLPDEIGPEQANVLFGALGLDYAIHVVQRVTSDLTNTMRIAMGSGESDPVT